MERNLWITRSVSSRGHVSKKKGVSAPFFYVYPILYKFAKSYNILFMENLVDKSAAKEAIIDVGVGFFMAFPVALAVISFSRWIGLGVITTAVFQTIVFTLVSLTRKYFVRVHFKRINNEK